jgi:large subunit ribosomal protein L35
MPKLKTHRGTAKRVRLTATGKIKRSKAYHSHILTKKDSKRKRRLVKQTLASDADAKILHALLPYGRP